LACERPVLVMTAQVPSNEFQVVFFTETTFVDLSRFLRERYLRIAMKLEVLTPYAAVVYDD